MEDIVNGQCPPRQRPLSATTHKEIIRQALADMNTVLIAGGLTITAVQRADESWLHHNMHRLRLNWRHLVSRFDDRTMRYRHQGGFDFAFKLQTDPTQPAGICLYIYDVHFNTLEVTALENFMTDNARHPLHGKMFKYVLYTLYFYALGLIARCGCDEKTLRITIRQAINPHTLRYYLSHADFRQIPGSMDCVTRFSALEAYIENYSR
ncbi:hypothetical protein [Serratia sp. Tan611]|uniref:hypothetical protein n=1 Tax=Serratia sp. Tan611 TaxID=2773264 RepID=UPI0019331BBC|nr:hypothetical protein [Serratia sp. Tan611]CAE1148489.1 conserved protein of unknown function [Serratia sp. Tan611]